MSAGVIAASAPTSGGYSAAILADSPVAYYRLGNPAPPSVAVSSASSFFAGEGPDEAFDGVPTSGTWTSNGAPTQWIQAQLSSAAIFTAYALTGRSGWASRNPKDWTLQGSNNGSTWTTIDTRTGVTSWVTGAETNVYTFTNTTAYLYYRLNVTAVNGGSLVNIAGLSFAPLLDSSGNGNHGYFSSGVTLGTTGLLSGDADTAATFAGLGRGQAAGQVVATTDFTVEALVVPSSLPTEVPIVAQHNSGGSTFDLSGLADGSVFFRTAVSGGTTAPAGTLVNGVKTQVVGVRSGSTLSLYINGAFVSSATQTMTLTGAPLTIGGLTDALSSLNWRGVIDEVSVYSSALSSGRIAAHYAAI